MQVELFCAICYDAPFEVKPAITIINGQAVCADHVFAAAEGKNYHEALQRAKDREEQRRIAVRYFQEEWHE